MMMNLISKTKLSFKLLLDAVMLILLALMYNKMAISMSFHEIGGLILFAFIIFHLILNYKWIIGVTEKLFSKSLPVKTRIGYIANVLLLISFILICVSGILISKVLFQFNTGMTWKMVHNTSAAIALILIGIHIGLHVKMISSFIKKKIKLPAPAGKIIVTVCLIALVVFGAYSITTTSFTQWLSMPFSMSSMPSGEMPNRGEGFQGREGFGSPSEGPEQGQRPMDGTGQGQRQRSMDGEAQGGMPENAMMGSVSLSNALLVIAQFISITAVFAALAYGFEVLLTRKKKFASQ